MWMIVEIYIPYVKIKFNILEKNNFWQLGFKIEKLTGRSGPEISLQHKPYNPAPPTHPASKPSKIL